MGKPKLDEKKIREGQAQLNRICKTEYGISLVQLLNQKNKELVAARLSRLGGVLLKKDFAKKEQIKPKDHKSTIDTFTKAKNSYDWLPESLDDPKKQKSAEYELLDQLRKAMPKLLQHDDTWSDLLAQADHERGLFKVVALYVWDKIKKKERKSLREYYEQKESPELKAMLNVTNALFNCAMAPVYASIIPVPGLVVSFSLIGIECGYDYLFRTKELGDKAVNERLLKELAGYEKAK